MLAPIHELVHIELPTGGTLAGDLSYAQTPGDAAVVWVHGFGSHRGGEKSQALEAACSRRGLTFAAFDFRGHGASSGQIRDLRATQLIADLGAIREYLAQRGIHRMALVGSSMGGFAAAWYALTVAADLVPACVLLAPAFRFLENRWNQLSPSERDAWRASGSRFVHNEWISAELGYGLVEEREQFRFVDLVARWTRPALIFHGLEDQVVPWRESVAFAEQVREPQVELRLLRGGDHRLTAAKDEIAEATCQFLTRFF